MQIVKVPRSKNCKEAGYEDEQGNIVDIVTAEDHVKVATLLPIHKEKSLNSFLAREKITVRKEKRNGLL